MMKECGTEELETVRRDIIDIKEKISQIRTTSTHK